MRRPVGDRTTHSLGRERGLSRKIGVVLLVSVALIITAIIGVYVLDIEALEGDQDLDCPRPNPFSWNQKKIDVNALAEDTESDENVRDGLSNESYTDELVVEMAHECGDSMDQRNIYIAYHPNGSSDWSRAIGTPEASFKGAVGEDRVQIVDPLWNPTTKDKIKPQESVTIHGHLRPGVELGALGGQTSDDLLEGRASCRVWGNDSLSFDNQPTGYVDGIGNCSVDNVSMSSDNASRIEDNDEIMVVWSPPNEEATAKIGVYEVFDD